MQRGWGAFSPFEHDLPHLPSGWDEVSAEQQCLDRPLDYLPDLDLVLEWAARCGGPVLDLACGTGRLSLALARHGYRVVGLDRNAGFIRRAREEAARLSPEKAALVRFEEGDARSFLLPERFGLVIMMDQAFKYLLTHDDQLACLHSTREHLREDGRFLVEQRCLLRFPEGGAGAPFTFVERGREWIAVETYDPIQQVGVTATQPADDPAALASLAPIRDFTYQELALLHRVAGFELDEVIHDLDEREPPVEYFDAALVLKKAAPWEGLPRRRGDTERTER